MNVQPANVKIIVGWLKRLDPESQTAIAVTSGVGGAAVSGGAEAATELGIAEAAEKELYEDCPLEWNDRTELRSDKEEGEPTMILLKYKRAVVAVLAVCFVSACSTMTPPRYSVNADTNMILRDLQGASVVVVNLRDESNFDAGCRLMGPIEASDNRNVGQFIRDSFNDEFKFAGIYGVDDTPNELELVLNKAAFSSIDGLTNGWWNLAITLSNSNTGESLQASTRYTFNSGFDAITACNQTADALTPAVQELIKNAVSQKQFKRMIGQI